MLMNRKTFCVAVIFLCLTLVWFGLNVYWLITHAKSVHLFDLLVGLLFVAAGAGMVYHEFNKKKRRHLADVDKSHIP